MKRKRPLAEPEVEESSIVKKRKSRSNRAKILASEADLSQESDAYQVPVGKEVQTVRNSKKRGKKDVKSTEEGNGSNAKMSLEPGPSSSERNLPKRNKKSVSDINQNGDIGNNLEVLKNSYSINKIKKKNGLQKRELSESPSDFQPLGQLVKKAEVLRNKNVKSEELKAKMKVVDVKKSASKPGRKKHVKKVVSEPEVIYNDNTEQVIKKEADLTDLDSEHVENVPKRKKHLKEITQHEEATDQEPSKPEIQQRKPKKKVRIDETESLKVKKELADTELHFSKRELPAKIIKSKLNKNMTEEVKVSPLTVQASKKEKKTHKNAGINKQEIKEDEFKQENIIKTEELQIKDEYVGNEVNNETSNSEDSDLEVYYINKNAEKEAKKKDKLLSPKTHSTMMPKEDQLILVQRVQSVIPDDDTKSYKYRLQKLEWEKVTFKNYLLEDCKKVWNKLLKKVRHDRLLAEITHDIKKVIESNDLQEAKPKGSKSATKKHPDMPKRPLTSYFLYYIRKRDKIAKERPELDTLELNKYVSEKYQNLPLEKKQKYEHLSAKKREEYKRQMEEFYGKHPEMRKVIIKKPREKKQKPPKRPENPYRLFMQSELSREEIADEDKAEFKEVCREKWRQMSDAKKLGWINLAEEKLKDYQEELKEYMALHPEYTPKSQTHKPFLSRDEINLKDKLAGKPRKPPSSAYSLFVSLTLQSDEIGNIPPKERWIYTSTKWKAMTDDEREQYKQLLTQVQHQYEKDFKAYLDSLPEDRRQEEILRNVPKKRKNAKQPTIGKNAKASTSKSQTPRSKSLSSSASTKSKPEMPIPPPRSAFKYFTEKHPGDNSKDAWKNLDATEKGKYEKELSVLKDKYIKQFEAFLKGLSKEELAAFCANRNSRADGSSSDESGEESEHGDNEDSSEDSSDDSESENESDEN